MKTLALTNNVNIKDIYEGSLMIVPSVSESIDLVNHAKKIVQDIFNQSMIDISISESSDKKDFVEKAQKVKSWFTNDEITRKMMNALIKERYKDDYSELLFDVPRLRIVPNSNFLSSGISYNYKAHRDSWYGGGQDQINHWMAVENVCKESTFYMAQDFFDVPVLNNSEIFDLDEWDSKYRIMANQNLDSEQRPHPVPLEEINEDKKYYIVIPTGSELIFSGHHLHGSGVNSSSKVRFSIDYRVCKKINNIKLPANIDCRASGDYRKYMIPVIS